MYVKFRMFAPVKKKTVASGNLSTKIETTKTKREKIGEKK